MVLLILFIRIS